MDRDKEELVDESTPQMYYVYDRRNREFHASGQVMKGQLQLFIEARIDDERLAIRGSEQFGRILQYFAGRFTSVTGLWVFGDNLASFNEATAAGASPEEAALRTWTGQILISAGYSHVVVESLKGEPGKYTEVQVSFLSDILREWEARLLQTCDRIRERVTGVRREWISCVSQVGARERAPLPKISPQRVAMLIDRVETLGREFSDAVEQCHSDFARRHPGDSLASQLSYHTQQALRETREKLERARSTLYGARRTLEGRQRNGPGRRP